MNKMLKRLPGFESYHIALVKDQVKIFIEESDKLQEIAHENGTFKLKRSSQEEYHFQNDLIGLGIFGYPLGTCQVNFKDGNENNYELTNINCLAIYGDYSSSDFLDKHHIQIVNLSDFGFPLHSITSDGHFINKKTGHVMTEDYSSKDGKGRVRLPLSEMCGKIKPKTKTIIIQNLIATIFLGADVEKVKFRQKNGIQRDNDYRNIEILSISENEKVQKQFGYDDVKNFFEETRYHEEENETECDFFGMNIDNSDNSEDEGEDDENVCDDVNLLTERNPIPHHDPIYEEYIVDKLDIDLTSYTEKEGKKWKVAKYCGQELKIYLISEHMELYSHKKRMILTPENSYEMKMLPNGDYTYRLNVNGKRTRVNLRDILGHTFLKTPEDAVCTIHRHWNKDNTNGKYFGQKNHYTNIEWLTERDFVNIGNIEDNIKLSNRGDLYSFKKGRYQLYDEKNKKNGLRTAKISIKRNNKLEYKTPHLHILTALHFCHRPDKSYKYVVHKDGDISNNHCRNLIWLNTLAGIHNDGVRYYNIPNCPEYVLSENNDPYSFKHGILKKIKLRKHKNGYYTLQLTTKKKEKFTFLFHRIVAATRNKDFNPKLYVDHIDRDITNYRHDNLRSVTAKMNSANSDPDIIRGKEIMQINDDGTLVEIHLNSKIAAKKLGGRYVSSHISRCARKNLEDENNRYKSEEFIWKYVSKKQEKYEAKKDEYFKVLSGTFQGKKLEYDNYMISNYGNIVIIKKGTNKRYTRTTYPSVNLAKNGVKKEFYVHVLVALVFVDGRTEERNQVNHIDENIYNFAASNLEWMSRSENMLHSSYKWSRPVKKICRETGNILGVYDSMTDAGRSCQRDRGSDIAKVVGKMNEKRHAYGFYWEYIEEHEIENYQELTVNIRKNQKINNI